MIRNNKPAYLIACGTILSGQPDPDYGKRAMPLAEKAQLKPIAGGMIGEKVKVLEGELPAGAVFMAVEQFLSMAVLEAFYYSDGYQSAIPFRKDAVKINFLVAVDGISEAELEEQKQAALAGKTNVQGK